MILLHDVSEVQSGFTSHICCNAANGNWVRFNPVCSGFIKVRAAVLSHSGFPQPCKMR